MRAVFFILTLPFRAVVRKGGWGLQPHPEKMQPYPEKLRSPNIEDKSSTFSLILRCQKILSNPQVSV